MTLNALIGRILQVFGLQISRLPNQPVKNGLLKLGDFLLATDNRELIRSYRDHPLTNRVITRVVSALSAERPEISMIDVGANCGDSAALAKMAHDLPIFCIEPDPHVFAFLKQNMAGFHEVQAVQQYLGESNAMTQGFAVQKAGWNMTLVQTDGGTQLDLKTLDEVSFEWSGRAQLGFLKCDTEGFDVRILHGARQLLMDCQPVILFEYNRETMSAGGEEGSRVFRFLEGLGYGPVLFYDAYGRFLAAADVKQHDLMMDFHDYAEALMGKVLYYDVLVFPRRSELKAAAFVASERQFRREFTRNASRA